MTELAKIQKEITTELANKEVFNALVGTTFKGLEVTLVKRAIMEGMMRGFKFKDFLEKNVYAIPFKGSYSLVSSIDYARKIGMKSGVVGKSAPTYEEKDGKIVSCTVTIKRKANDEVGEYTATVFFDEYFKAGYAGRPSLWETKPRTMIAKVAEAHALRMACPEELAKSYIEEEVGKDVADKPPIDIEGYRAKLEAVTSLEELKTVWASLPVEAKTQLAEVKEMLKANYENS